MKRLTLSKPIKLRHRSAREVMDAGEGDADDKATLQLLHHALEQTNPSGGAQVVAALRSGKVLHLA